MNITPAAKQSTLDHKVYMINHRYPFTNTMLFFLTHEFPILLPCYTF